MILRIIILWPRIMAVKTKKTLLTEEGFKKLSEELAHREGELRNKLQEVLNQMRSQGDLRENDGYSIAVEDFQNNEERINEIKKTLSNSEISANVDKSTVDVGSKVTVKDNDSNQKVFTIVGEDEANPLEGKVSYKSPLGESLMGKKKGEKVSIHTPAGETTWTIVSVE